MPRSPWSPLKAGMVNEDDAALSVYADALSARAIYFSATRQVSKFLDASLAELAARRKLPQQESKLDVALINVGMPTS